MLDAALFAWDRLLLLAGLLFSIRLLLLLIGAAWDLVSRRRRGPPPAEGELPPTTALVPAYNEARVVLATVDSILASPHPRLSVLVVDDGSTDGTAELVEARAAQDPRVRLLRQPHNQGKAAALNAGLQHLQDPVVVTVDADTVLDPDCISRLIRAMEARGADAVAANLKVGNRSRWLTAWQSLEYVVALNLGRRAQATFRCITTIPGAAAAFRRSALVEVGGWSPDTPTEDTDVTIALLRAGRKVEYEPMAVAFTEAPSTLGALIHQRTRWLFGYHACLWKHRRAFLRLDSLGLLGMPNLLMVHVGSFILMLMGLPYAPRLLQWAGGADLAAFLFGFLGLDLLIVLGAHTADREGLRVMRHAPLHRVLWPFFLLFVFLKVVGAHVLRTGVRWHKLARTGEVADAPSTTRGGSTGATG